MKSIQLFLTFSLYFVLTQCSKDNVTQNGFLFANAEPVIVQGYSGPMEDPVVSPEGAVLFFDSFNDGGLPSHLYWAKRTRYNSVQFMGPVGGVNDFSGSSQTTLRGNYDLNGNFYFAYADSTSQPAGVHIAHGTWNNGTVTGITLLTGISTSTNLTFDVYISPDGNTLLSDFVTFSSGRPASSIIFGAAHNGGDSFSKWANSDAVLSTLNSIPGKPVVYNSALTPDGAQYFCNRRSHSTFVDRSNDLHGITQFHITALWHTGTRQFRK